MAQRIDDVDILRLRAEGMGHVEIAAALGCTTSVVSAQLARAREQARRDMANIAGERLVVADARIEWMLDKVAKMIASDIGFDDKKYKVAIALLERQAKMLGYDRQPDPNKGTEDWMEKASKEKLVEYAEELGLSVPTTFD